MSIPRDLPSVRRRAVAVGLLAFAATWPAGTAAATTRTPTQGATAQVTVVHGLRGQLVDVYLDGTKLLDAFAPDRLTEPMAVPVGRHTIDLRPAGTPATDPPKATASPDVPAGSVSVVAHFTADGGWTMSLFRNDVSTLAPGAGRLVLRNTSAVSPVAVAVRGGPAVPPLDAGQEAVETVAASSCPVAVTATDGATLIPDDDVSVSAGAGQVLYLVGRDGNLTWLSQTVAAGSASPNGVAAGDSGLAAASDDDTSILTWGLMGAGVALIAAPTIGPLVGSARRRRRAAA